MGTNKSSPSPRNVFLTHQRQYILAVLLLVVVTAIDNTAEGTAFAPGADSKSLLLRSDSVVLRIEYNGSGYGVELLPSENRPVYIKQPTPLFAEVVDRQMNIPFSTLLLTGNYSSASAVGDTIVCTGELSSSMGSVFTFKDVYSKADQPGAFRLVRDVQVTKMGVGDQGFFTAYFLQSATPGELEAYEMFTPGIWYKDGKDTPEHSSVADYSDRFFLFREDRLPIPLQMMREKTTGLTFVMVRSNPDGNTVANEDVPIMTDAGLQFGSIGICNDSHLSMGYVFPGTEGERAYFAAKWIKDWKRWKIRRHPVKIGVPHHYELVFKLHKTDGFASAVRDSWRLGYTIMNPKVIKADLEQVHTSVIELLNKTWKNFAGVPGVPDHYPPAGFPFQIAIPEGEPILYTLWMGFVGQQEPAAFELMRYGLYKRRPAIVVRGEKVIDFWVAHSAELGGCPRAYYDVGDKIRIRGDGRTGVGWRPHPTYLRFASDGMMGIIHAWELYRKRGFQKPAWLAFCRRFGDWLISCQNLDGSWARSYDPLHNSRIVDASTTNTTHPIPFLIELYYATGDERYKDAAIKSGEFAYVDVHQRYLYVGGTPDNPNVKDKEGALMAFDGFLALYDATSDSKWLQAATQAADCAETWTYAWNVPSAEAGPKWLWPKGRQPIGLSIIATGHSGSDSFIAYYPFQYFRLYLLTGDRHYLDFARMILHNTKQTMNWDRKNPIEGWKAFGLQPEAGTVCTPRGYLDAVDPVWVSVAAIQPISQLEDFFGDKDIDDILKKRTIDQLKKLNTAYASSRGYGVPQKTESESFKSKSIAKEQDKKDLLEIAQQFFNSFSITNMDISDELEPICDETIVVNLTDGQILNGKKEVIDVYNQELDNLQLLVSELDITFEQRSIEVFSETAEILGEVNLLGRFKEDNSLLKREVLTKLEFKKNGEQWRIIREQCTLLKQEKIPVAEVSTATPSPNLSVRFLQHAKLPGISVDGNLVAWWDFDRVDSVACVPGVIDRAIKFNGLNFIESEIQGLYDAITISVWLKVDQLDYPYTSIVSTNSWGEHDIHFLILQDGSIQLSVCGNDPIDAPYKPGAIKSSGKWMHLAVCYNSKQKQALYFIDGKVIKQIDYQRAIPVHWNRFCVGSWKGLDRFYKGLMDEICIFGRTLDVEEVEKLYQGKPIDTGSLLKWTFDDISDDKIVDQSDKKHFGILKGIKVVNYTRDKVSKQEDFLEGNIKCVPGVVGKAVHFDGYTSYMNVRSKMNFVNNGFTLEAWVAPHTYSWNWTGVIDQEENHRTGFSFGIDDHGHIGLQCAADDWQKCITTETIELLKWSHIAATYDSNNIVRIYIDGKESVSGKIKGQLKAADSVDVFIGKSHTRMCPTNTEREPSKREKSEMIFDGLIDEVKIYNTFLSAEQIKKLCAESIPKNLKPLSFTVMPEGPIQAPNRFRAYYTRLAYIDTWDDMWPVGPYADIVVTFDESPTRVVFWRGTNYGASYVTDNNIWIGDQSLERYGARGCHEHMSDKQCRYAHARIIENNNARVVVHWRYALCDIEYELADVDNDLDWGIWADEYFLIYPDGVVVRHQVLWPDKQRRDYQWQETIFFNQPGTKPEDNVEMKAISLVNLEGQQANYSWEHGYPKSFPQPKEPVILMTNLKSKYKHYLINQPGGTFWPFGGRNELSHFRCWNHWPVAQLPNDGRVASAFDRPSHTSLTIPTPKVEDGEKSSKEAIALYGLTNLSAQQLVPLAKSWISPPKLIQKSDSFIYEGYCKKERAYVLGAKGRTDKVFFTLSADENSPVVNPAFVIKNFNAEDITLKVDGRMMQKVKDFRYSIRDTLEGSDLIIWIKTNSAKTVSFEISTKFD